MLILSHCTVLCALSNLINVTYKRHTCTHFSLYIVLYNIGGTRVLLMLRYSQIFPQLYY